MGVHRDGGAFSLTIFESEMGRRLWWQLCLLDVQTSEDDGLTPITEDTTFNSKLPAHINDSDTRPEDSQPPMPRQGWTE